MPDNFTCLWVNTLVPCDAEMSLVLSSGKQFQLHRLKHQSVHARLCILPSYMSHMSYDYKSVTTNSTLLRASKDSALAIILHWLI